MNTVRRVFIDVQVGDIPLSRDLLGERREPSFGRLVAH